MSLHLNPFSEVHMDTEGQALAAFISMVTFTAFWAEVVLR